MMNKIRVLMVDDNKQLVDMVKEYFSSHAVISLDLVANDGVEGLEVINNHLGEFDLILLDLIMPKKDGISVLEEVKDKKNKKLGQLEIKVNSGVGALDEAPTPAKSSSRKAVAETVKIRCQIAVNGLCAVRRAGARGTRVDTDLQLLHGGALKDDPVQAEEQE